MAHNKINKIPATKYNLVFCRWLDAVDISSGWTEFQEVIKDNTNSIAYQVGYIIKEDNKNLWMAGALIEGKEDLLSHVTRIPKGMIQEIIYITKANKNANI